MTDTSRQGQITTAGAVTLWKEIDNVGQYLYSPQCGTLLYGVAECVCTRYCSCIMAKTKQNVHLYSLISKFL